MKRERRVFTIENRLSIIQEGDREGTAVTCRKYSLAPSLYARWKKKYLSKGMEGLKPSYHSVDPELRALLEEENERLKRIITSQALEIEVKSELLKKTPIQARTRR